MSAAIAPVASNAGQASRACGEEARRRRGDDALRRRRATQVGNSQHAAEGHWIESNEARLLVAVAPAGLEASWAELSSPETPLERLVAEAARCGIEITGPPLGS